MKRYGLIGEKLSHSFSKEIHEAIADYTYDLMPLSREEFPRFMEARAFTAINVTIPYKKDVIPYLDSMLLQLPCLPFPVLALLHSSFSCQLP